MLPRADYLSWAIEAFPRAKWDLATSGLPSIAARDLGVPDTLSDPSATRVFTEKIAARYRVPVDEVVPALGTSGAVWTIAAALAPARGEPWEVLIEEPTYEPLLRV